MLEPCPGEAMSGLSVDSPGSQSRIHNDNNNDQNGGLMMNSMLANCFVVELMALDGLCMSS